MTIFERIKKMNVEQMAEYFSRVMYCNDRYYDCINCHLDNCPKEAIKEFLQSEV